MIAVIDLRMYEVSSMIHVKVSTITKSPIADFFNSVKTFEMIPGAEKRLEFVESHLNEPAGDGGIVMRSCGVAKRRVRAARVGTT